MRLDSIDYEYKSSLYQQKMAKTNQVSIPTLIPGTRIGGGKINKRMAKKVKPSQKKKNMKIKNKKSSENE